jgi:outer membrane protein assembly factor BamB
MRTFVPWRRSAAVLVAAIPLALVGCGNQGEPAGTSATTPAPTTAADEAAAVTPRLVVSHDQGLQVLDANTLKPVADLDMPGFNRLNAAGDGRHIVVSTTGAFQILDAGTWAEPHGDHSHYYTSDPVLTETRYEATKPGHVVVHAGRTALFDDGTGKIVVQDSAKLADGGDGSRTYTTSAAHHGVAVELTNHQLVVSEGTEDARTGIRVLDEADRQIAASEECPGVHGEAVAEDETVVIGCENGALIFRDGKITKVASPDSYGRIGNQAGSETSPIVLGDYKTDKDAELERPTRVSLINTDTGKLQLVDLPASYTFRSLGRGADGEALVLGTDGALHVIDPATAKITRSIPVLTKWTEPDEWQSPRPTLRMLGETAYVTDPATNKIYAVDYATGKIYRVSTLTVTPNELEVAAGESEHAADHQGHDHHEAEITASPSGR